MRILIDVFLTISYLSEVKVMKIGCTNFHNLYQSANRVSRHEISGVSVTSRCRVQEFALRTKKTGVESY